ncbi:MAG: DUF2141 domain-containing protein [Hyphomonas sp.]|nr:DUF2141 domain-containing protein [Hyphomonas sp.]
MSKRPSGTIAICSQHIMSPECFGPAPLNLMVRCAERSGYMGPVTVMIWDDEDGFPWSSRRARRTAYIDPDEGQKSVVFMGLRPGRYAVTAFADQAGSGRLKRNLLGRPKQPVFFVNSVPSGPKPVFRDHVFVLRQSTIVDLKMFGAEPGAHRYRRKNRHEFGYAESRKDVPDAPRPVRPAQTARGG